MDPLKKTIKVADQEYRFRYPTALDMMEIDAKALQLREGVTEGLSTAVTISQYIATLEQLCEAPKNADFRHMRFDRLNKLSRELNDWITSFLGDMGEGEAELGHRESD